MNKPIRKSPEWLAKHHAKIGGSNAAAAVGLNPYKSPTALYYEMVDGIAPDLENNPDVLRGLLLEPIALQRLQDVLGIEVLEHDQDYRRYNKAYPWASCVPDAWIRFEGTLIPVEAKVPSPENWRKLDERVPDYIQCQAVHNATVLAVPVLMLVCLNPVTMELYRQLYEPVPAEAEALMECEEAFFNNHILRCVPPDPKSHDDLKLRWPEHVQGKRITATEDVCRWHDSLAHLKAKAKEYAELADRASFAIKEYMADAEVLADETGKALATYRSHQAKTLDSKRLKNDSPEVWNEYARDKTVRTFLVKKP